MSRAALSLAQARRVALAAQGFGAAKGGTVTARALGALATRLGCIQIDSVNVLVRSHFLPAFSRLGAYDRGLLERVAYGRSRALFEYWAHEASLVPLRMYPLLRWRMERARGGLGTWKRIARISHEQPGLIERIRTRIEDEGPLAASDFEDGAGQGSWWGWSDVKAVLEYLFWSGVVTTKRRRPSFEREYELAERVIPALVREIAVADDDAQRELVRIAARALGVATEADLRDYFRLDVSDARARVAELVERGELVAFDVEGWRQPGYAMPPLRVPRKSTGSALLSPFDALVWRRERTERLFGFTFRLEIYTPKHKRVHGYYVLPYLLDERLVARVDLKADRAASTLRVHAAHFEPGAGRAEVGLRLRDDLRAMADWLALERVALPRRF